MKGQSTIHFVPRFYFHERRITVVKNTYVVNVDDPKYQRYLHKPLHEREIECLSLLLKIRHGCAPGSPRLAPPEFDDPVWLDRTLTNLKYGKGDRHYGRTRLSRRYV